MWKFLIIGVIALAIAGGFLFWKFGPNLAQKSQEKVPANLTVWGLWEDEKLIEPAIEAYKKVKPDTSVKYVYQSSVNYRTRTQTRIQEGEGPDIFMIHDSWVPMFLKTQSLSTMPAEVMSLNDFSKTFYPVVRDNFTNYLSLKSVIDADSSIRDKQKALNEVFLEQGKIYGLPRGIDGLALYYNEDILKSANVSVPKTWNEFREAAFKLTVLDQNGVIQTAGAAMGTVSNVDHWQDLIGLLFMQQPNAKIDAPNDQNGIDVLKFYTDFAKDPDKKVWDGTMPPSTQAFASGKLAFYFAPSWRAHELRQLNPQLNFKTAPVPQLANKSVGYANYFGYGVSAKSKFSKDAWEFLKFLTSAEIEKLLYQEAAKIRLFGLPYSRVDLQKEVLNDPLVGAFVQQGPNYKDWYLASGTRDQGINEEINKYYEDAVNAVVSGGDIAAALETANRGIKQVLEKYTGNAAPAASGE